MRVVLPELDHLGAAPHPGDLGRDRRPGRGRARPRRCGRGWRAGPTPSRSCRSPSPGSPPWPARAASPARWWPAPGPGCCSTRRRAATSRRSPEPTRSPSSLGIVSGVALLAAALWLEQGCRQRRRLTTPARTGIRSVAATRYGRQAVTLEGPCAPVRPACRRRGHRRPSAPSPSSTSDQRRRKSVLPATDQSDRPEAPTVTLEKADAATPLTSRFAQAADDGLPAAGPVAAAPPGPLPPSRRGAGSAGCVASATRSSGSCRCSRWSCSSSSASSATRSAAT